jgi:predicted HicB family RNase H-like nuclease
MECRMPRKPSIEPTTEPIKRVMVPMPDSLHHRIRVLAAERRQTMAEVIREALEREVARGGRRDAAPATLRAMRRVA